jgi:hypothetical protein
MYGMVNQAVKSLVVEQHGDDTWAAIRDQAGAPDTFAVMQPYEDDITYNLVGAASSVLGEPAEAVLFAFGEYWVRNIAVVHYETLMSSTGTNFVDFVRNLDHMHQRIRVTFPDYRPPSFRVIQVDDHTIQVDYYSERDGLLPFVEGLFTGLGAHFGVSVELERVPDDDVMLPCKRLFVRHGALAA